MITIYATIATTSTTPPSLQHSRIGLYGAFRPPHVRTAPHHHDVGCQHGRDHHERHPKHHGRHPAGPDPPAPRRGRVLARRLHLLVRPHLGRGRRRVERRGRQGHRCACGREEELRMEELERRRRERHRLLEGQPVGRPRLQPHDGVVSSCIAEVQEEERREKEQHQRVRRKCEGHRSSQSYTPR
ncbi:unnamed protein product [Musa hybrid cultivar]